MLLYSLGKKIAMSFKISLFQGPLKSSIVGYLFPSSSTPHFLCGKVITFQDFLFTVKLKLDFHKVLAKF